jgi:hypothetical protein
MSNYIEHLMNRSFDDAGQVKPRLPSLFEPLPDAMGLSEEFGVEENSSSFPAPTAPEWNAPQVPSFVPPFVPPLRVEPLRSQKQPLSTPTPPPVRASSAPTPALTEPHLQPSPETPQPTPQSSLFPLVPPSAVPHPSSSFTADAPVEPKTVPTTTIAPRLVASVASAPVPAAPLRPAIALSSTTAPGRPGSPLIRSLHPETIASPQPAAPAPTIQVNIGRIEVRATLPAAPTPPKSRPTAPVMSLEDYLRQRGNKS